LKSDGILDRAWRTLILDGDEVLATVGEAVSPFVISIQCRPRCVVDEELDDVARA
jgi:hypothetical protein